MRKMILAALLIVMAFPAYASDIDSAKAAGQIGERTDGYLGIVAPSAGADVKSLVDDVNGKRRAKYQQVSRENGQPLSVVEKLAGEKAIKEHVGAGQYYMNAGGAWVKK
jgi:uncharacterized protein YdbL (DUF1318 family)